MKVVNHKTLTSALFALLMFTVAVSGGCGGGGSGTPVSSTQNLVDGFTNEYASPDVMLSDPEEISSDDVVVSGDSNADDEFGDGEFDDFTLLAKTTWNIQAVTVKVNSRTTCQIEGDNSKNTKTVTLITDSAKALAWAAADNKKHLLDDLTIQFRNPSGTLLTAPILRAGNFSSPSESIYDASISARSTVGAGTERIVLNMQPGAKTPKYITVRNEFSVSGTTYTSNLALNRVDNFLVLDQTDWKIKDVQVFGFVRGADGSYTYGNPQNYVVTDNEYQNYKMTLYTTVRNNRRFFEYRYYPAGVTRARLMNHTLMFKFRDNTINKELSAPFLRSGGGFEFKGKQGTFDVIEGILKDIDVPGNEVLQVSEYGPNSYVFIDNSVYYRDQNNVDYHYWVRTTLEPIYFPDPDI